MSVQATLAKMVEFALTVVEPKRTTVIVMMGGKT